MGSTAEATAAPSRAYTTTPSTTASLPIWTQEEGRTWWDYGPVRTAIRGVTSGALALALNVALPDTLGLNRSITDPVAGRLDVKPAFASHLEPLVAEMESYRQLTDGWDGVDSVAPIPGAIDDALAFLAALPPDADLPEAAVASDGTVGWFWKKPGVYIDVIFLGGGRFAYYGQVAQGTPAKGEFEFDRASIPQDLLDVIMSV
jgi:hypothetical protein